MLNMFKRQGFTVIEGVGGIVQFMDGRHEILHRTFVYAPGTKKLAARMLNFPNTSQHQPPAWVPRQLATYVTLNADLLNAFDTCSTLVDDMAGEPDTFKSIIKGIKNDRELERTHEEGVVVYRDHLCVRGRS